MNFGMCGRWRNGELVAHCTLAGSEECDFECPLRSAPKPYQCDACDWKGNEQELVQQCVPCCPMCLGDVSEAPTPGAVTAGAQDVARSESGSTSDAKAVSK